MRELLFFLWLAPLGGAILCWTFGPWLRRTAGALGSATVLASFAAALALIGHGLLHEPIVAWAPGFILGLQVDPLTLIWTLIITGVGGLIHVYSIGYMWSDRAIARFFAYMNFFVFAMLTLVLSDNLVGLLIGWGLVGLASYFLIGFWFYKPSAVAAARKAFVINVVGDVGMMFAIFVAYAATGSIAYADVFSHVGTAGMTDGVVLAICIGLFIGAAAKSAQVPLHTWLPDAMEGPTPVSALIHAATMVTAGVYLVARFAPLWNVSPSAQNLVGIVGAMTMVLGAVLGMGQWDIKRILAYSTMSQIGYMIVGVGVGAYQAGVLHFFTHAFFKAQLFLASGIIIHALHDEQDIRRMGGLAKRLPFAYWAMLIGTLAIIGFPFLSGFFSKDAVIYGALQHGHPLIFTAGIITAGITAYYMFRMFFVTFGGTYRGDVPPEMLGLPLSESAHATDHGETHEHAPAWLMSVPVGILMVPSVLAGWLSWGGENSPWYRWFEAPGMSGGQFATTASYVTSFPEWAASTLVLVAVAAGFATAFFRYGVPHAQAAAVDHLRVEAFKMPEALTKAFWVDDFIAATFVRPAQALGAALRDFVDPHVIDAGVRDVVWLAGALGYLTRYVQNGMVRGYAFVVVAGAAVFVAYFALLGAAR